MHTTNCPINCPGHTDPIITDIKTLRQVSKETTPEEIAQLELKARIIAALPSAWVQGFGLSAIQIGVPLRYAYLTLPDRWRHGGGLAGVVELINPKITKFDRPCLFQGEGCLSLPGHRIDTIRYEQITMTNNGGPEFVVWGTPAVIVQHEIAHMNGKLIFDFAVNPYPHLGRNDRCGCGSGKKYKKCCLK